MAQAAAEPFDLAARRSRCGRGCCAAAPGVHVLVLVIHHIATDGWSTGIFARDLSAAYAARREGRAPGWAPLPVQYADYAIWQRELLGDGGRPGQPAGRGRWPGGGGRWPGRRRSWRCPPTGRARPWPATAGTRCRWRSPPRCTPRLAALAREQGVTMFMVVQAALAVLLSKLGAGDDIPVGTGGRGPDR